MRLAVLTLADAVNSRENMLSMLSAGVTAIRPEGYPAVLGVDLAMLIELDQADLAQERMNRLEIKVSGPTGDVFAEIGGELGWNASDVWPQHVPAPITLRHLPLAQPGRYVIAVRIGELEQVSLTVNAEEPPAAEY